MIPITLSKLLVERKEEVLEFLKLMYLKYYKKETENSMNNLKL